MSYALTILTQTILAMAGIGAALILPALHRYLMGRGPRR